MASARSRRILLAIGTQNRLHPLHKVSPLSAEGWNDLFSKDRDVGLKVVECHAHVEDNVRHSKVDESFDEAAYVTCVSPNQVAFEILESQPLAATAHRLPM